MGRAYGLGRHTNTWGFPTEYDNWQDPTCETEWLNETGDLPIITDIIEVVMPEDSSRWFTLNGFYEWEEATHVGEERYELKGRELWYIVQAYLVKKVHVAKLLEWANKQTWMGHRMPESHDDYNTFLGEFFRSPVFKD